MSARPPESAKERERAPEVSLEVGASGSDELWACSARALRARLRAREISSEEIVRSLIARGETYTPQGSLRAWVGGFTVTCFAEALSLARAFDAAPPGSPGALAGLPLTVKDNIDVAGLPTTLGLVARRGWIATRDAAIVARARRQGAIVLGKSNVPQLLASGLECDNPLFGVTRNPCSPGHGPGGSSGGEAALVASGQSLFGLGTDLGGSIRSPANYCGVVGLKPTGGAWPNAGLSRALPGQETITAQCGPIARDVGDCELLFEALTEARVHDAHAPPVVHVPDLRPGLEGLRIGYYDDDGFLAAGGASQRAVARAKEACAAAGAQLVPFAPRDQLDVVRTYLAVLGADGAAHFRRTLTGEDPTPYVRAMKLAALVPRGASAPLAALARQLGQARTAALLEVIGARDAAGLWALAGHRAALRERELLAWDEAAIDAVLCPAAVTPAVPLGESHRFVASFAYPARYNLFDMPAGVLPVTRAQRGDAEARAITDRLDATARDFERRAVGLPAGVQVVARPWQEARVFRVMRAIEAALREAPTRSDR